jgi:mono/diheme cytochrome c family protein
MVRVVRFLVMAGVIAVLIAAAAIFGRRLLAWSARQWAADRMAVGAFSTAQQWLDWSGWFDPWDGRIDLMRATCLRRRYQQEAWTAALESARQKGAPADLVEQEERLGRIQAGKINHQEDELNALLADGVAPHDACTALVHGYLVRQDASRAEMVLSAWAADEPISPHVAYMQAVYWLWQGDRAGDVVRRSECRARAEKELRAAIAREPRHEMARQTLADILEEDDRLAEALPEYVALAALAPANDKGKLGVARMLRSLGRLEEARLAMARLRPGRELPEGFAAEQGQIALEAGDTEQARQWFSLIDMAKTSDTDALKAAALAFAIEGKTTVAEGLFARLDREHANWARTQELQLRLATGLPDPKAAEELRRLTSPEANLPGDERLGKDRPAASVPELYAQHCGGCHGVRGDGKGRAARHLFPKPRDFRTENLRLASTVNRVASLEDVASVVQRGVPGTSMRAYAALNDEEQAALAGEVLRLRREGLREQTQEQLKAEGEELDAAEVERIVALRTTPDRPLSVPAIGPPDAQAIARGKALYRTLGCANCHGDEGQGNGATPCYDEGGRACPPRNLVHDPMKGGPEPESLYRRIFLGMPGTPHPSCSNASEDQLVDLVQYCRSLSREPKRERTEHQRAVEASRLEYEISARNPTQTLGGNPQDADKTMPATQ